MTSELEKAALEYHMKNGVGNGKIEIIPKVSVGTRQELSLAYTPGVAVPCLAISADEQKVYDYTVKGNTVFVVSDGSAVLGLGNIGCKASLPVMEGKALLFRIFGGIDAYPIIISSQETEEIIRIVKMISSGAGGVNLEDISAPRCFEIEKRLSEELDIPVFHDDQHGTAIVTLAGLINALKLAGKNIKDIKTVINGSGAAGAAIAKLLLFYGARNIIMCDRAGIIYQGRPSHMNPSKEVIALMTNPFGEKGRLENAVKNADVFIGVSAKGALTADMIRKMASKPIIFAMANPDPEILPAEAAEAGAFITATGRSDFPNQVNNCLGFPAIFRGLLDVRAKRITDGMKLAAALALSDFISIEELTIDRIIPSVYDFEAFAYVAEAVGRQAVKEGVARIKVPEGKIFGSMLNILENSKKRFFKPGNPPSQTWN
jgi:malate dehydrogenase (oxaloacetate-decarboxylating)